MTPYIVSYFPGILFDRNEHVSVLDKMVCLVVGHSDLPFLHALTPPEPPIRVFSATYAYDEICRRCLRYKQALPI